MIRLSNVEKCYESRAGKSWVLRRISLEIRGGEFVRSLYQSFWVDGQDLSHEAVLQREAERQGFASAQIVGAQAASVDAIIRTWNDQWAGADHQGVPLLQRSEGTLLVGLMPVDVLQRFLAGG